MWSLNGQLNVKLAFQSLQNWLTTVPILSYPDFNHQFILDTDASNTRIGAVLSQEILVTYKELLAVVIFTQHFGPYLLGQPFVLATY